MTRTQSSFFTVNLFQSMIISLVLAFTIIPIILLLTTADTSWTIMATLLWSVGSILVFHPFVLYVYPHLLTKVSVYILTSILIFVSTWFNITLISFLLPSEYMYYALFNATITQISLWGSSYIIFINAIITRLIIISNIEFYKEDKLF